MKNVIVIFGASSSIGKAVVLQLAKKKNDLVICGRDVDELQRIASDAMIRYGVAVVSLKFDASDLKSHDALLQHIKKSTSVSGMITIHGYLPEDNSIDSVRKTVDINYTSIVTLTQAFLKYFVTAQFIAVVSSVAGERGKKRNILYNSAKGAVSIYLDGLRQTTLIPVVEIRPGFVDTPMAYGIVSSPLVASPEHVAKDIVIAIEKRKKLVYTPFFWRYIMFIIRNLPSFIFNRLRL